jgi:transcriptional regulator with XRE-family HTH domain
MEVVGEAGDKVSQEAVAERFAANLARLKCERGLSLTQISERAGIHRTHLGLLLRGGRLARIDTIAKLAFALDVPPSALLDGVCWKPPSNSTSNG